MTDLPINVSAKADLNQASGHLLSQPGLRMRDLSAEDSAEDLDDLFRHSSTPGRLAEICTGEVYTIVSSRLTRAEDAESEAEQPRDQRAGRGAGPRRRPRPARRRPAPADFVPMRWGFVPYWWKKPLSKFPRPLTHERKRLPARRCSAMR